MKYLMIVLALALPLLGCTSQEIAATPVISTSTFTPSATLPQPTATLTPTSTAAPTATVYKPPLSHAQPCQLSSQYQEEDQIRLGFGIIRGIEPSPDENLLALETSIGIYLLDADSLEIVNLIETQSPVTDIVWSPDSTRLPVRCQTPA